MEQQAKVQPVKPKPQEVRLPRDNKTKPFAHPWLAKSLKGHTNGVSDMDLASNGRYLASAAEEDPADDASTSSGSSSRGSSCSSGNSSFDSYLESSPTSSSSPSSLTHRQRVNRKHGKKSQQQTQPQLENFKKLNVSEQDCAALLYPYRLTPAQMLALGYPMENAKCPGHGIIFKSPYYVPSIQTKVKKTKFDVNAREFVPRPESSPSNDSGQGSSSSSDSESGDSTNNVRGAIDVLRAQISRQKSNSVPCVRCSDTFILADNDGHYTKQPCTHHWGKLENSAGHEKLYVCCNGRRGTPGCTVGDYHVWSGLKDGFNGPIDSYVRTQPRFDGTGKGAYAIDCEMIFTTAGLELAKVTVIAVDGRLVYESLVKPVRPVVDYNTRFSGITKKDLSRKSTKTLGEVQNDLLQFISADTILVGHGLENDLRALKLIHSVVVDSAVAFPHKLGLPYRMSLKQLVCIILNREIQSSAEGHNSYEDASACMDLMLQRIHYDSLNHNYPPPHPVLLPKLLY